MPNETKYRDCNCKANEIPHNADYVHNSSTPIHCCDNDKCECHHPLRLWAIKYEVLGVPKFSGVAIVQAKDLCNAELVFIQNSKFNGMREYLKITCIDELYPNPEPLILQEDSAAILDKRILKTYPFLLRSEYYEKSQELNDTIIQNVQDYIGDIRPHIDSTTGNWFIGDQDTGVHAQGDKGEDGNDGADGFSPLVSVSKSGSTTTISVTDEQGTTSSTITDGSNGESAYEIWLEQGHTGTEEDFLNWLREGEYLKQIKNLDDYEGEIGEIVQYKGETNSKYTNGYIYKKVGTQTIIPAGTDYIQVSYDSNRLKLGDVGIENGIYYKTDKKDEVTSNIRDYFLQNCPAIGTGRGYVPVSYRNTMYLVQFVYAFYTQNNQLYFNKIAGATYDKVGNVYIPYDVTFEDGTLVRSTYLSLIGHENSGVGNGEPIPESKIIIFENIFGQKIYCIETNNIYNLKYKMLVLNDMGDYYQVVNPDIHDYTHYANYFSNGTTTEEQIIGDVTEWQQWDSQPRDDTSHFVTDSDIGWIEH